MPFGNHLKKSCKKKPSAQRGRRRQLNHITLHHAKGMWRLENAWKLTLCLRRHSRMVVMRICLIRYCHAFLLLPATLGTKLERKLVWSFQCQVKEDWWMWFACNKSSLGAFCLPNQCLLLHSAQSPNIVSSCRRQEGEDWANSNAWRLISAGGWQKQQ